MTGWRSPGATPAGSNPRRTLALTSPMIGHLGGTRSILATFRLAFLEQKQAAALQKKAAR